MKSKVLYRERGYKPVRAQQKVAPAEHLREVGKSADS